MSFTENLYLKRQLKQLQEENLKLKQILSEAGDILGLNIVDDFMRSIEPGVTKTSPKRKVTPGAPAEGTMSAITGIVDDFMKSTTPIGKMTPVEAYKHGQDHARRGITPPEHFFTNPHFAKGFKSVRRG